MLPSSTVCDRVYACFHPVKTLDPADGGTATIIDCDQLHVIDFSSDAGR